MTRSLVESSAAEAVFDVVVVGYGAAGAAAAIAASASGASVLLIEKMPDPGGISIVSAGGVRIAFDEEGALKYLRATCDGRTPDELLRVFAAGMCDLPQAIERLLPASGATMKIVRTPGNYPLPGYRSLGYAEIDSVPALAGAQGLHAARKVNPGVKLFKVLEDNVAARGVEVWLGASAQRLETDAERYVRGVQLVRGGRRVLARARQAVVLTCGGFEADDDMKQQYFQAKPVAPGSFLGNTGDGVRMAQAAGAALWHMWHYHGPYGLRHPDPGYPFAIYLKPVPMWTPGDEAISDMGVAANGGATKMLPRLAWILCDRNGKRFMDEYPPYPGDFGVRPLDLYDSKTQSFPRIPAFMVFDEAGRRMYPLGRSVINDRREPYAWSADNLKEVKLGFFERADTLEALAAKMGVAADHLAETVAVWNAACAHGRDAAFGRRPETMAPIAEPPFYFGRVWPVVINTQGGPVHDAHQRVLNPFGEPVGGLYAAGELGSLFGHLYLSGGNLAECLVGGAIAGRHAAALPRRE